jgi:hypothetical protein
MFQPGRYLWIIGILFWVVDFLFVLVPAGMSGGELQINSAAGLFLLGLLCILVSLSTVCRRVNRETNGALGAAWGVTWRVGGTTYLGYKAGVGIARHLHQEITK